MDEKHITDTVGGQLDLVSHHSPIAEHTESPSLLVSPGFVFNELVTFESRDISRIPVASSMEFYSSRTFQL